MKTDFEARPIYVKPRNRILDHFITCFIALVAYWYLEKKQGGRYTIVQIRLNLQEMDFMKYEEEFVSVVIVGKSKVLHFVK